MVQQCLGYQKKLKLIKNGIRSFCKANYSNLEKRVEEAHSCLLTAQNNLLSNPTTVNAEAEALALEGWLILSKAEEHFLLQKTHITWIQGGDCGSAYFHRLLSTRRSINYIHFLKDDHGNRVEGHENIQKLCIEYFSKLMTEELATPLYDPQDLSILMPYRCSKNQKRDLMKDFTRQEIKDTFFSLPRNKTCSLDGYYAEFFTGSWSIVGAEATDAILEFFKSGSLLNQWNATTLILIPKLPNSDKAKDFRPISCVNTLYKVISRLLTKRLQDILTHIISPSQTAFIKGRLLAENVLLATELVHGYNRRNISRHGMLKVDLRKAFDSIRWDFILSTLRAIDIPENFVKLISECITSPTFSVSVNGSTGGISRVQKDSGRVTHSHLTSSP